MPRRTDVRLRFLSVLLALVGLVCIAQQPTPVRSQIAAACGPAIGKTFLYQSCGGAAVVTATTFDLAHHGNSALSNGNLTVIHTGGGNNNLTAFSIATTTSNQKVYVEAHVINVAGGGGQIGFGVDNTLTADRFAGGGLSPAKGAIVQTNGTFFDLDSVDHAATLMPSWGANDNIDVALDTGMLKFWIRKNNGAWNASLGGTQNPATGQGGVTVTNTPSGPWFFFVGGDAIDGDGYTATFQLPGARTAPSGFTQLQ